MWNPTLGAAAAASLKAEDYFDTIRVFERRECAGGTWYLNFQCDLTQASLTNANQYRIYDANPGPLPLHPGALPPGIDPPLHIPDGPFPRREPSLSNSQNRFDRTPIYEELT